MIVKILLFSFIPVFLLVSCSHDHDPVFGPVEKGYPRIYFPQPAQKLVQEKDLYHLANHPGLSTSLDTFGFISTSSQIIPNPVLTNSGSVSEAEAKKIARKFIHRNAEFTGVTDTSLLIINRINGMTRYKQPDFCHWNVVFKNQLYNGLEVENTGIYLHLDSLGVYRAGGHWYPEIVVPGRDNLSYEMAKKQIAGLKLITYGWSGPIEHTINNSTDWQEDEIKKVIYPLVFEDRIELHVVWQLFPAIWRVLVDTSTGEVVHSEPTVIF